MTPERPLAAASRRLRGRPGRKPGRKSGTDIPTPTTPALAAPASGVLQVPASAASSPAVVPTLCPPGRRLLPLEMAARYLGLSAWTLRDWLRQGVLPVVRFDTPTRRGRPFRRILVDVCDLDALITRSKMQAGSDDVDVALCAPPRDLSAARAAKERA